MIRSSFIIISLIALLTFGVSCTKKNHGLPNTIRRANTAFSFITVIKRADKTPQGFASGVIVHHYPKNTYVLTAGHVCTKKENGYIITDKIGRKYNAEVFRYFYIKSSSDICLLETEKRIPYAPITIAHKGPEWGDHVWTLNAGSAYFHPKRGKNPGVIQIHKGYYSGYDPKQNRSVFTQISIWPGASGAMILNRRGQLVSMTTSIRVSTWQLVHEISYGATLKDIKFLMRNVKMFP
jgi:S1-C subfamily serine protease